nr:hypothetical protein [Tanacetum cinerariifolium]
MDSDETFREILSKSPLDVWGIIDAAITFALKVYPDELKLRRNGFVERLNDDVHNISSDSDEVEARYMYHYPQNEFGDFDRHKEEHCFKTGQFWAYYEYEFQRCYFQITKVQSSPFRLELNWLVADPESQEEIAWVEEGLPVACGKFKLLAQNSLLPAIATPNYNFSHQILAYVKDGITVFIYPQKGEIWALYKDWDIKWSSNPESHLENKYEIVEVLSDFDKEHGIWKKWKALKEQTSQLDLLNLRLKLVFILVVGKSSSGEDDVAEISSTTFKKRAELSSLPSGFNEAIVFHDFNSDKLNWSFQKGQIWAINIGRYGQIKKIKSSLARLHVDLLELCSDVNRPNSCGLFRASKDGRQIFHQDSLLYPIEAELNGKNRFNIYPRKKEIWVLMNKVDTKHTRSDLSDGDCSIVEVVQSNEDFISILALSRVPGYKSVFRALVIQNSSKEGYGDTTCGFKKILLSCPGFSSNGGARWPLKWLLGT